MKKRFQSDVLAFMAHPDDESFVLGGTVLKLWSEGKTVGVICATRGDKGDSHLLRSAEREQLAKIREQELYAAARILKTHFVEFLDYRDGELFSSDFNRLVKQLADRIEKYRPSLVLTFGEEGITGHHDHITIGHAAQVATQNSRHAVSEIWRASIPHSLIADFRKMQKLQRAHHTHYRSSLLAGVADEKLLRVDIKNYRREKTRAISCHKSQGLPPWTVHKMSRLGQALLSHEYFEVIKLR